MNRNGGDFWVVGAERGTDVGEKCAQARARHQLAKSIGECNILPFSYQQLSIWYSTQKGRSNEEIHSNELGFVSGTKSAHAENAERVRGGGTGIFGVRGRKAGRAAWP